jgi:putative aldouronate transport system substrate-binding protein
LRCTSLTPPDGNLLRDWETDEFKAAVGYVRDLFAAGVFNPDQPTFTVGTAQNEYLAGRIVVFHQVLGNQFKDTSLRGRRGRSPVDTRAMPPFAAAANVKPVSFPAAAGQQANAFRKGNPERIKELLRICDWLAAPFGTGEEQLLSYGLKDVDYTRDPDGNPIVTTRGPADSAYVNWRLISPPQPVLYFPELPSLARVVQDAQRALASMTITDPTAGYFSPTFLSKGRPLEATVTDGINDIIAGRRPRRLDAVSRHLPVADRLAARRSDCERDSHRSLRHVHRGGRAGRHAIGGRCSTDR